MSKALSAPLDSCPYVFFSGEDEHRPGRSDGLDFGFLHSKTIYDAGHDKELVFKIKGLEAVDPAIRQLTSLRWQQQSTGVFQNSICIIGDHSTPVEYGDYSFKPVTFLSCS
ncbi:hypothetical protein POM88_025604 [Heracleum sosnowskyi]|uniref:Metalloenzyme domain-containing protein n=1 Tax=Heracleum sosnowskyi TaxID=360622 RepID=A0AAD8I5C9_9APIA|nr:hypothetical protein POM88_025604 [Heracleum sosnowskyi]